jgi:mannose-1-phosphate guanylyltransferase
MAGGRGERFWPLSTLKRPKQVLSLVSDRPMISLALDYLSPVVPSERTIIVTAAELVHPIRQVLKRMPARNIIGEPVGRDTAAACALAWAIIRRRDPQAVIITVTADHVIGDLHVFRQTLKEAAELAASRDVLITIGMQPSFPHTGYGYIETGDRVENDGRTEFRRVVRFVEKPDRPTAEKYIQTRRFFWNSGMFVWSVQAFEAAMKRHRPALYKTALSLSAKAGARFFKLALLRAYSELEKISVDYAIMEKAGNIIMARGRFRWQDVGSWSSLAEHLRPDKDGNHVMGQCEAVDAKGNIVMSNDRVTALIGVHDMVVVHSGEVTLICPRDRAQDVKNMVRHFHARRRYRHLL